MDHLSVGVVTKLLTKELEMAKDTGKGTYKELVTAWLHLERARGIYITLATLELVSVELAETVGEDLTRIEDKLLDIKREKDKEVAARYMQRGKS